MSKLNVFWILIDSARNFETNVDDRGLPKSVVDFSKDAIFFKNTVTSAPSTLMSISSMMTGIPSYLLSRSYENFPDITKNNNVFPHILAKNGYDIFGSIYFKHGREVLSSLFGYLSNKFLPKGLSHRKQVWNNEEVYSVFKNILKRHHWKKPTFCYLHYNVRVDDNISEIIQKTIDDIKSKGLFEKSLILINSDHGYPLPSRNWDSQEDIEMGWGHDRLLTNDNILTPLIIKYPGSKKIHSERFVSSLDIIPTLCGILKIPNIWNDYGFDLLNDKSLVRNDVIRTDNRYICQIPNSTSIISDKKKLIVITNKDETKSYEYYDLVKDPGELTNQFNSDEYKRDVDLIVSKFRANNDFFLQTHEDFLFSAWKKIISREKLVEKNKISIIIGNSKVFQDIVRKVFIRLYPNSEINLINYHSTKNLIHKSSDITFCIIDSEIPWNSKKLINASKGVPSDKIIFIDNNGLLFKGNIMVSLYLYYLKKRKNLFIHDKIVIFDLFKRLVFKKLLAPIK